MYTYYTIVAVIPVRSTFLLLATARRRRRLPGIRSGISASSRHAEPCDEVGPPDRVLRRFRGNEPGVLQLDACDAAERHQRHAQRGRAGGHGFVPRLAPGDLDE